MLIYKFLNYNNTYIKFLFEFRSKFALIAKHKLMQDYFIGKMD